VPIVIVITRADQIDAAGDQMLNKGLIASKGYSGRHIAEGEEETEEDLRAMSWDERVEWIMQMIRTVALRCTYARIPQSVS
jgi:repressor of nif and glnA expression